MCSELYMEWISVCGMSKWKYNSEWPGVRASFVYMPYRVQRGHVYRLCNELLVEFGRLCGMSKRRYNHLRIRDMYMPYRVYRVFM